MPVDFIAEITKSAAWDKTINFAPSSPLRGLDVPVFDTPIYTLLLTYILTVWTNGRCYPDMTPFIKWSLMLNDYIFKWQRVVIGL